ncbi:nucleotidyltransferase family protein [Dokdonella sp.]|uniref:nucleotidyltransferase family protein n=1 Tax=Dokdonella sp. TaxID=2291710 RepID=UPI003BB11343
MPEDRSPRHGAVILAAGHSHRLGIPKQLLQIDAETLVHRAVRFALETDPLDCIVVALADATDVERVLGDLPCRIVACADSARGMSISLQTGLQALDPACAAGLIVLVDQPAVTPRHLCALRDAWLDAPSQAAASGYADTIGVPAMLPRTWFGHINPTDRDHGARDLLRARRAEVQVVAAARLAFDIDSPDDLAMLDSDESC